VDPADVWPGERRLVRAQGGTMSLNDSIVESPQDAAIAVPVRVNASVEARSDLAPHWLDALGDAALSPAHAAPLVEAMETFAPRANAAPLPSPLRPLVDLDILGIEVHALLPRVSHRQFQTTLDVAQGGRGSCWAFGGIAALEAAYARVGIHVDLSEQYLFHLSKAHEAQRNQSAITSLIGFQGAADIVHHLTFWAVPLSAHVPYLDQPVLQALANSITGTGGALSGSGGGSLEQADWFEYDLRSIPLMGRWYAQYRAKSYGTLNNFNNDDIKRVINAGYDVVVNVFDKINNGGHVLLIFGYDDNTQTFEIKNSQGLPGFTTMRYVNDPQFNLQYGSAYYITEVQPVQTQWSAMWIGRWEIDHDGWRGRLIIRRFCDVLSGDWDGPSSPIPIGTWYGENGQVLPVSGKFVAGGRGLHCTIGGQPFELYLHTRDPYRAAGRCFWNGTAFGVVLSRGTAVGAGDGFARTESIGLWDTVHDGWRGRVKLGVDPYYVEAASATTHGAWIEPGSIAHQVDTHIDFGGDNTDQKFQLLVHTREDGLLGGVTGWGGQDWPVEGRMAQNLYTITSDGTLKWYRHDGRPVFDWDWQSKQVGNGWGGFHAVFGGGDGVVYAVRQDGVLLWYFHDGRNQGSFDWRGPTEVGTGWAGFHKVFAGDGGVIYAITTDGRLLWYRHLGRRDGTPRWLGPIEVGTGWASFPLVAAGPDGTIYAGRDDGTLLWYRHYGHDQGYPIWHGPLQVGTGWQPFDSLWPVGNGYVYARTKSGFAWRTDIDVEAHHATRAGLAVAEPVGSASLVRDSAIVDVDGPAAAIGALASPVVESSQSSDWGRYRPDGDLWLWRHHGFLVGDTNWTEGVKVGTDWGYPGIRLVFAT
jgi:hypothetical protein